MYITFILLDKGNLCMQSKVTIAMTIFAAALVIAGMSTMAVAVPSPSYPNAGYPYGGLVSSEAQNGPGGFGDI